jgi:hypothetical protein
MSGEATVSRVTEAVETGSIIAVYRRTDSRASRSAAVFVAGDTQGQVKRAAFEFATQ